MAGIQKAFLPVPGFLPTVLFSPNLAAGYGSKNRSFFYFPGKAFVFSEAFGSLLKSTARVDFIALGDIFSSERLKVTFPGILKILDQVALVSL